MSEDLSAVDDALLTRWAYARPGSAAESERARLASAELEQRAAQRTPAPPSGGMTISQAPARAPVDGGHPAAARAPEIDDMPDPDDEAPLPGARTRPRRRILVAAGVVATLVVAAGFAIPPLLDPEPQPPSSLAVFDRDDSAEEREYLTLLLRQGQNVSYGPRVLGTIEYGTVVAYRSIRDDPDQSLSDEVCLAIAEFDRAAQSPVIADRQCIDRDEFDVAGASVTLFGIGGQYDVDWGPSGRAKLDVLISEAQRRVMDPGIEGVFLDLTTSELDLSYLSEQRLLAQTGLAVEQLRGIFPVPALLQVEPGVEPPAVTPESEWVTAYTAVPLREAEQSENGEQPEGVERVACLAVLADGEQRESRCVSFADIGSRGILLEFERDGRTILVSWSTTGEISAQTVSTD